jgi:NAD(P)-dependent dehydrogenase (short-subunit alcohol dehydrogenase family)
MQVNAQETTGHGKAQGLEGKVALVTGAARGLGFEMARALLGAGASVVFADVDESVDGAAAKARESTRNLHAQAMRCDISNRADCERLVQMASARFGGIDVLVNNAGKGPAFMEKASKWRGHRFFEADPDAWREVIDTNVCGAFYLSHYAAPGMMARGWGRIINITTSLSTIQRVANSPYGVSKAAIEAETLIWAKDLEGSGVTCNSLIPGGAVDTEFVSPAMREATAGDGRALLRPDVMNAALLWLASPQSDGVTGKRFVGKNWDAAAPCEQAAAGALEAPVLRSPDRA